MDDAELEAIVDEHLIKNESTNLLARNQNINNSKNSEADVSNNQDEESSAKKKKKGPPGGMRDGDRKKNRNLGLEYTTRKGETRPAKMFKSMVNHKCKFQCSEIKDIEQQKIFERFWKMGDWSAQNAWIVGSIKQVPIKRRYTKKKENSRRGCTRHFSIATATNNFTVCKTFYLNVVGLSNGRVQRALQNARKNDGMPMHDQRGKHSPKNKIPDELIEDVKAHINSIPRYASHHKKKNLQKKEYLHPDLNVKKMYDLYVEECKVRNKRVVKEWAYRHVFKTSFNLRFHEPVKEEKKKPTPKKKNESSKKHVGVHGKDCETTNKHCDLSSRPLEITRRQHEFPNRQFEMPNRQFEIPHRQSELLGRQCEIFPRQFETPVSRQCEIPMNQHYDMSAVRHCELPSNRSIEMPVTRPCEMPINRTCEIPISRSCELPITRSCEMPLNRPMNEMPINRPMENSARPPFEMQQFAMHGKQCDIPVSRQYEMSINRTCQSVNRACQIPGGQVGQCQIVGKQFEMLS